MTKIKQIQHFQTCVHRFSLLMPLGDFHHHHTLYIMYASRFKSPKNNRASPNVKMPLRSATFSVNQTKATHNTKILPRIDWRTHHAKPLCLASGESWLRPSLVSTTRVSEQNKGKISSCQNQPNVAELSQISSM